MSNQWKDMYEAKRVTPAEAVGIVRDGDVVFVGSLSSVSKALMDALADRLDELNDISIAEGQVVAPGKLMDDEHIKKLHFYTFFMDGTLRRAMKLYNNVEYSSVNLSEVHNWARDVAHVTVAALEVSSMDEDGYFNLGPTGPTMFRSVIETADRVIVQVNRNVPRVAGEQNRVHISEIDLLAEADTPVASIPNMPVDETVSSISNYILEQIPDGACIQLGLGSIANAVGFGLKDKNDLGIHTEMYTDSMMELTKLGVVNNSKKTFMPGKSVTAFAYGTPELYEFLDQNEDIYFGPYTLSNSPINIAKNDNMISINTALSIDLLGQVCADNLNGNQYSGIGGQMDFVRGAQMANGGKSFIAIASTAENKRGRFSKIVSRMPEGAVISTPRCEVQYVVTEHGCVNLKKLTHKGRVEAMISLAHPDFREQLRDEAKEAGLL